MNIISLLQSSILRYKTPDYDTQEVLAAREELMKDPKLYREVLELQISPMKFSDDISVCLILNYSFEFYVT